MKNIIYEARVDKQSYAWTNYSNETWYEVVEICDGGLLVNINDDKVFRFALSYFFNYDNILEIRKGKNEKDTK